MIGIMIPYRPLLLLLLLSSAMLAAPTAVFAQSKGTAAAKAPPPPPVEAKPAPYDDRLARLSEVLGSVHYLRTLCKAARDDDWRAAMRKLLDAETASEPARRARMTAAFNRGYRSFASVYTDCTPAAIMAEEGYRNEGATLAGEIAARFGN
jgi:uncharacterized protein (TIGR02301 family)